MIRRRIVQLGIAGMLMVGINTPAFASGTLTHKFTDLNTVDVMPTVNVMDYGMATTIGTIDSTVGMQTFVSAVRKTDGNLRLNAYYVNPTTYAKLGADADDGGAFHDVAIAQVDTTGLVVAAVEMPDNTLKFIAYDVNAGPNDRTIQRLNDFVPTNFPTLSTVTNVQITGIGPLLGQKFVTLVRKQDGSMRLDSWQATRNPNNTVTFTPLSVVDGVAPVGEIALIRNTTLSWQFVTLHQDSNDTMNVRVWSVDQNAAAGFNLLASRAQGSAIEGFDVAFSSDRILTARYTTSGVTSVERWSVVGQQINLVAHGAGPSGTNGLQIFDMGGGDVVVAQHDVLGFMSQHTMSTVGSAITLDPGGMVDMHQAIDGMSGVDGGGGRLFYAIADGNGGDLSHQLWHHQ
ncbi:hypothetical protein SE18_23785 [Herpetosiphon geysericola]|uniref:DUF4394 domain-containing protein n=2 Tax=Herpetosiphon geysericola TaxID=70996 RepID=A0A0P6YEI3_9CHLR|nr:hypothetical protein SE18_23785 [Herpetosiphon geysericola]